MAEEIERMLRLPAVLHATGLSKRTIYRWTSDGRFPGSIQLGANIVAWRESDVRRWLAGKFEETGNA